MKVTISNSINKSNNILNDKFLVSKINHYIKKTKFPKKLISNKLNTKLKDLNEYNNKTKQLLNSLNDSYMKLENDSKLLNDKYNILKNKLIQEL